LAAKLDELEAELEAAPASPESPTVEAIKSTGFLPVDTQFVIHRPPLGSRIVSDPLTEASPIGAVVAAIDEGDIPDADIIRVFAQAIKSELDALNEELTGKTKHPEMQYPNNLTLANWADWSCLPTLVYHLEYPRQESIDWYYVAEKTAATLGVIWVMIVVSQSYIYPRVIETVAMKEAGMSLQERWNEFPWVVSDILFPMLLEQLLTWYVIWECALNVLAETTRFADRNFYGLWWNSISWDQYARDWNRPVHEFLLRHVYNSSISSFHLSKATATFVTFLLSALVHELVMFCIFKKVRGFLFAMQLAQIPLAQLSRTKLLRGRKILGNLVFWFGLFVGPSIITSLYLIV
jgi:sterol O-acyltransferase